MKRTIAIVALLQISPIVKAGGSFSIDNEFSAIRAQIPSLWQSLNVAFDLEASGGASMIGNNVNERLGHRRVGPYCLAGKPKAKKGANTLLFCFNTDYTWLDAGGNNTVLEKAFDVKEKFKSLEITPIKE